MLLEMKNMRPHLDVVKLKADPPLHLCEVRNQWKEGFFVLVAVCCRCIFC